MTVYLGSLFVLLAGANVWGMLHASRPTGRSLGTRLVWAHRIGGYAFVFLFCAMCFFMALRLKGVSEELPARVTIHLVLVLLLAPILLVKILIARHYRQYTAALLPLGVTIFALSFVLVAVNLVPYVLGRAQSARPSATFSRGFVATVLLGSGFLLVRRPARAVPPGSRAPIASPARTGHAQALGIRLRLARVDVQTHDTKTLRFILLDGPSLAARPGQFLTFHWRLDGEIVPRSYSISSSPAQTAYVEITPKRMLNGCVSSFLTERADPGLEVEASGPYGNFYFDDVRDRRVVLIAGGSGITPLMSMLRYIDDRCLATPVTLLYGVRSRDDVIFGDELARLGQRLRNFRVVIVPSRPDAAWNGPQGRLSRELVAARVDELATSTFFLCGPPPFMATVQEILHSLDVGPERIRRESFGAGAAIGDPAASVQPSGGTVEFARSGTRCPAAPGQTLLDVAEAHGVGIPSGCRQGRCGTCTTKLLEGDVEMAIEEGLDPSAKADGYVLTCVARPRGLVRVDA